jgi:hypothetical protein
MGRAFIVTSVLQINGTAKACKRAGYLLPVVEDIKAKGAISLHQIAAGLNKRGIKTARGCDWSAIQVQRVLKLACMKVWQP